MEARSATTVRESPDAVYARWRRFEDLPSFMAHLESVTDLGGGRSHWVAAGPGGTRVEWDAELVEDEPGRVIAWRSIEGADVRNAGRVELRPAPAGQGTEIVVQLDYDLPGGKVGELVAKLLGEEPATQVKDDLRRFKQVVETGEIVRSDGTVLGLRSTEALTQRPAQPIGEGAGS